MALVIADVLNPFFPEVAAGVLHAADSRGWQVVVYTTSSDLAKERQVSQTVSAQADACVGFLTDPDAIAALASAGVPLVLLDKEGTETTIPGVSIDFEAGVEQGISHLVERGHVRIAMIDNREHATYRPVDARRDRFLSLAARLGLPVDETWVLPAGNSVQGGAAAMERLLAEHPDVTAVFAYNDLIALGAMRQAIALGRSVPGDLAVVGFDGLTLGELVDPPLTTLSIDKHRLGILAVEHVAAFLPGAVPPPSPPDPVIVPMLVCRGST
ncbi:substrate-binding domain-containing protein [Nonomuraea sp. SMC257]|uniref:Substrate-binding domain-containing protein n=1 Tax=Nonomuraea montanisoli TaxID=2741721 RepID=A0A7Y6ICE7_9ACTN|nr:substrate-binding domain-containing protein [Nonomuraea montanisoli]NUW35640.1 substrate-binding domain-containing protein [Nonomuraea montanisoli]